MSSRALANRAKAAMRRPRSWLVLLLVLVPTAWLAWQWLSFPSDRTPEGAYLRVVKAVNRGQPSEFFAYIDDEAQHACFTIGDYRRQALEAARQSYPAPELAKLEERYGPVARAERGPGVFAYFADKEGWMAQLRSDLSGIESVETSGKRATVQTAKGSRYSFRERPNGIYGLTAFTPALVEEAERAARDLELVQQAAQDYRRAQDTR